MNRKDRRANRKLSRHATPEEIFPAGHGPVQSGLVDAMKVTIDALRDAIGKNYDVTLFVAERLPPAGEERLLPRFNYMSTAQRADMAAVLEAFAQKNKAEGAKLDKINDEPPTTVKS